MTRRLVAGARGFAAKPSALSLAAGTVVAWGGHHMPFRPADGVVLVVIVAALLAAFIIFGPS
jgi:hypothetical protein